MCAYRSLRGVVALCLATVFGIMGCAANAPIPSYRTDSAYYGHSHRALKWKRYCQDVAQEEAAQYRDSVAQSQSRNVGIGAGTGAIGGVLAAPYGYGGWRNWGYGPGWGAAPLIGMGIGALVGMAASAHPNIDEEVQRRYNGAFRQCMDRHDVEPK